MKYLTTVKLTVSEVRGLQYRILLFRQKLQGLGKTPLKVTYDLRYGQLTTSAQGFCVFSVMNKQAVDTAGKCFDQSEKMLIWSKVLTLLSQGMLAHDDDVGQVLLQFGLERCIHNLDQVQFEQTSHDACDAGLWRHQCQRHGLQGQFSIGEAKNFDMFLAQAQA